MYVKNSSETNKPKLNILLKIKNIYIKNLFKLKRNHSYIYKERKTSHTFKLTKKEKKLN